MSPLLPSDLEKSICQKLGIKRMFEVILLQLHTHALPVWGLCIRRAVLFVAELNIAEQEEKEEAPSISYS